VSERKGVKCEGGRVKRKDIAKPPPSVVDGGTS
jgi:hypothetical protein